MRTRIEISDTFIGNAPSTVAADTNPQGPLKVCFSCGASFARAYMDFDTGLLELMKNICKNNHFVRKLKIEIELENEGECGDGVSP